MGRGMEREENYRVMVIVISAEYLARCVFVIVILQGHTSGLVYSRHAYAFAVALARTSGAVRSLSLQHRDNIQ